VGARLGEGRRRLLSAGGWLCGGRRLQKEGVTFLPQHVALLAVHVPNANGHIASPRRQPAAIGRKSQAAYPARVSGERRAGTAGADIDKLERSVFAGRRQCLVVAREKDGPDGILVNAGFALLRAARQVPEFDLAIAGAGGQGLVVARETHGEYCARVSF